MKKQILRVQPWYTIFVSLVGIAMCLWLIIFACVSWEFNLASGIPFCLLLSLGIIYFLYYLISHIQYAILDNEKLIIKGLFYTIVELRWDQIYAIKQENIMTHRSSTGIGVRWKYLVINKSKNDRISYKGGENKKNTPPWQIVATKRNKAIIGKYYNLDLE